MTIRNLYGITFDALSKEAGNYYSRKIFHCLYRKKVNNIDEIDILKQSLLKNYTLFLPKIAREISSEHTKKYLLELEDKSQVETVLMKFANRYTACISTQVGCAVKCVFCATGRMGLKRNLTTAEIVAQVALVNKISPVKNIVFMGMGEPLHNYEATMKAIEILTDDRGIAIASRRITLSTVGIASKILRLSQEKISINLAVSLHGASDESRNALVPMAKKWPLKELLSACKEYSDRKKKRIFFEWTVIAGKNDTIEEANLLGKKLKGIDSHVNLIPLNPIQDYQGQPGNNEDIQAFQETLKKHNIPSTIRQKRGIDIAAGCGQLIAHKLK